MVYYAPGAASDPRGAFLGRLRELGVPAHGLAAVDMNAADESGWNPRASGDGGNAFGVLQWNGPRKAALMRFAKAQGRDPGDPLTQADFFHYEATGPEAAAWNATLAEPDAGRAGATFVNRFERPAEKHRAARAAKYSGGDGMVTASSRGIGGAPGGFTGLGTGGMSPDMLKLLLGQDDFDMVQLAGMMGVEPEPMTTKDKWLAMMTAAGDVLGAEARGHSSDFAATNAYLRNEENRRAMSAIQAGGGLGMAGAASPAAAAAQQLRGMGREDLARGVETGAMEPQKGLELAVAANPVPGQDLSGDQERLATTQQAAYVPIARQAQTVAQTSAEIEYLLSGESRLGDQVALQRIAKALDPLSVVREGEVSFVASAAGGLQAVINGYLSQLDTQNGVLTAPQRAEILSLAAELQKNALGAATQERMQRAAQLQAQGIDPDTWLIDPSKFAFEPGQAPKGTPAPEPAPLVLDITPPAAAAAPASNDLPPWLR